MTPKQSLRLNFEKVLELPPDAISWLLDLWHFIQIFDDYADGDPVERNDTYEAAIAVLVKMPANPFFRRHADWLHPQLYQMVMKWAASDIAERSGQADERSFMWRAGYYDVVCQVTGLVHGSDVEKGYAALRLYGEAMAEYRKEFPDA